MQYQLHDYEIDSVTLEDDKIIFSFPDGFYVADDQGQEIKPRRKKLVFTIDRGLCTDASLESFIFIRKRGRFGWKDISFKQFTALFKKGNMIIYDEFDSKLGERKIIQLTPCVTGGNIELLMEDIVDIACLEPETTTHTMKLHAAPFEKIKSGEKTIELRLYDEKRQKIKVGDTIVFTNNATGETLTKQVLQLHVFDSFRELYEALPLLKCGYTPEDIATAHPCDMDRYYSLEEQEKYGVVGIALL